MSAVTGWLVLGVGVAGGVGAALRLVVDGVVKSRTRGAYPLGTTVINVSGSFALGLLTGLVLASVVAHPWQIILGTGLLGGYTTFSTASFETVRLTQEGRYVAAATNGLGMLIASVLAAALGLWLGSLA